MPHIDQSLLSEEQTRELQQRELRRQQKFRVGTPFATEKFESSLTIVISSTFTAAQGLADATIIISTRDTDLGVDMSTGFLRAIIKQDTNQYRVDIGDIVSGLVTMPYGIEPRTMVIGISPTDQGRVKAWVNGALIVDSAYDGTNWTNGIQSWFLRDAVTLLANTAIPEMEVIVGALPAIF